MARGAVKKVPKRYLPPLELSRESAGVRGRRMRAMFPQPQRASTPALPAVVTALASSGAAKVLP
jgi:hypothetical protein